MAFDPKTILKTVAPWIGAAMGGPLGAAAVAAIGDALSLDKPTEGKIASILAGATTDQLAAIQKAEHDFQERMQALGFESVEKLAEVAAADRDSARNREVQVRDLTPRILAYGIVLASLVMACLVVGGFADTRTTTGATMVGTVLGYLFSEAKAVLAYYFGSSAGSDKKTDLLAQVQGATDGSQ